MRRALLLAILPVWGLTGCPASDPLTGLGATVPPDQLLDYNQFVCGAMPVLVKRCSFLACHGQPDHALRVYSLGKLRLTPPASRKARSFDSLTADEVEKNFESASGMVYGASSAERQNPAAHLSSLPLLYKPVRAAFGGGEHHGVGLFPAPSAAALDDDPEYAALAAWVRGQKQPSPVEPACQKLFDLLGLTPR